ncbi:hypothetical protein [Pantoea trifolii]|uniref:Uncharacterized protein n=1 Tax=Pantoea trifolii TaxID=2968030 RepID=A0ABT1VQK0_9GAMM|nr:MULTISPECIES: hypothetical protein [unclassified Pantoea]MCQ8229112.1 hypothetical protein [Pantoea sp. MMK2]MCQ8237286.1 hypothetical protein [Pantoea sp. MMK3]
MSQMPQQSNEAVLYNALCANFPSEVLPLTTISRNSTGTRDFIVSQELALNFDNIRNCSDAYSADVDGNEKSPDALFLHEDVLYFVEFKEGNPRNVKKLEIRNKIHEGIITLYQFSKKHTSIVRSDFFKLKIAYIVFRRPRVGGNAFTNATDAASANYFIENIKGFIVRVTAVSDDPQYFVDFFHKVTSGRVTQIHVFDHNGSGSQTLFTATAIQAAMSAAANTTPPQTGQGGVA